MRATSFSLRLPRYVPAFQRPMACWDVADADRPKSAQCSVKVANLLDLGWGRSHECRGKREFSRGRIDDGFAGRHRRTVEGGPRWTPNGHANHGSASSASTAAKWRSSSANLDSVSAIITRTRMLAYHRTHQLAAILDEGFRDEPVSLTLSLIHI